MLRTLKCSDHYYGGLNFANINEIKSLLYRYAGASEESAFTIRLRHSFVQSVQSKLDSRLCSCRQYFSSLKSHLKENLNLVVKETEESFNPRETIQNVS